MDTASPSLAEPFEKVIPFPPSAIEIERRIEFTLTALKTAIAEPQDHRLFQSGKFAGLFPSRSGTSAAAALEAIKSGLFESVRTESKGKLIVEWVRPTPKGVRFVHEHDSPKAVLLELREVLGNTRSGLPGWMTDTRTELAALAGKFEEKASEMLSKLDELTRRVEVALRRVEAQGPQVSPEIHRQVPWAMEALEYLDRRILAGATTACPLKELFRALTEKIPGLAVPEYHAGLRHLHDNRAIRLQKGLATQDPEYALLLENEYCTSVVR